ncbi:MAG: hypothetical protein HY034_07525 [Nitrospirae bacterium]|nr:hypothetical protein [Nitrospirota bacterium]
MSKWFKTGIFLILIIAVASGSAIYKKSQRFEKCDFDGVHIKPIYRVDAILKNNDAKRFDSIYCAYMWLSENKEPISHVMVRDEVTGEKIDASIAYYVDSEIITNNVNNNRVHAFLKLEDAERHAKSYRGRIVKNPFEKILGGGNKDEKK